MCATYEKNKIKTMERITASKFYNEWVSIVDREQFKNDLLENWKKPKKYTAIILKVKDGILTEVASKLGLEPFCHNYYGLDAVLYLEDNKVKDAPPDTCWLQDIKVAFEHENYFSSGLFKEVSHLCITNCDLRVLVTYPDKNEEEVKAELDKLHGIICGNRLATEISDNEGFLIVLGERIDDKQIFWEEYIF